MTMKSVGWHLRTDGKSEVKNDFAEVKKAGEDAMAGVAIAAEEASARAEKATNDFTERQIDGYRRQAAAAKIAAAGVSSRGEIDAALAQPGNRGQFATVNLDRSTGAASASADVFLAQIKREEEAEKLATQAEEARAATMAKLRALLDPLSVAQKRYDDELGTYDDLLRRGSLSEDEHAKLVSISTSRLNEARRAIEGHGEALGLNRMQMIVGASAAHRFADSILAGQSPMRAFMMQAGDVATVLQADDGGVAGGLAKVRSLITPTSVGIAALGALVAAGAVSWYSYSDSVGKLQAASLGSGRILGETGAQLEANAIAAADAGHISVAAAREIESSYLKVAQSKDVLVAATAATEDFAAATGIDAKAAAQQLSQALADPAAGAQALTTQYGLLTQAQIAHIVQLEEEGRKGEAQRALLDAISDATKGAALSAQGLAGWWRELGNEFSQVNEKLGTTLSKLAALGVLGPAMATQAGAAARAAAEGAAREGNAAANQALQAGADVVDQYSGDNRGALRKNRSTVINAMAASRTTGDFSHWGDQAQALDAYTRALQTWIPAQEKATQLADLDAKIAAAKTPALRSSLAATRAQVAASGEVATAADVQARAQSAGAKAAATAAHHSDAHAKSLAREAESMEVSARAALDVADAYLKSSAAGLTAEARRKAATDATRKGIDVDAQARRQLNLQVAEGVASGAKSVAQLRDETSARQDVLAKVRAGAVSVEGMNEALADEAALRPLLALRTVAQGAALDKLNTLIAAYRTALDAAHTSERGFGLEKALSDSVDRVEELRIAIADLAHTPLDRALNAANRAANHEADGMKLEPGSADRLKLVRAREVEAQAKYDADRAGHVDQTLLGQRDQLTLSQRELELVSATDATRQLELDKLKVSLDIRRQFPDLAQGDVDAILAGVEAQDKLNERLKLASATMDELRSTGDRFLEDLLNPDGSGLKSLLHDIENEFIKLAALNPLKNFLLGENNPTLGGVIGKLGGLLGGGGGGGGFSLDVAGLERASGVGLLGLPHNATGTENWSGGMTWVGENGPELVNLPQGARVTPAAETRRLLGANDSAGGDTHIHVYAQDAVLADTVRSWVAEGVEIASVRGAAGGASISEAQSSARRTRKLGRYG